jgi:hypothetical protein
MPKWDAAVWAAVASALFAGLAIAVSLFSLYFSIRKPVSEWQRDLRSRLRDAIQALRVEIECILTKRPGHLDLPRHRARLNEAETALSNAKDGLVAPRPRDVAEVIQSIGDAMEDQYSQSSMYELRRSLDRLLKITNALDNGSLFAHIWHRRRWGLKLLNDGPQGERRLRLRRE